MTTLNPAVGARPGWRGTDPDGGTWVRMANAEYRPWLHIDRHGTWQWRSQEEAEAAGLVAVVAETEVGELTRERDRLHARIDTLLGIAEGDDLIYSPRELQRARLQFSGFAYDNLQAEIERLRAAAPAPLDPGNPEHRAWAYRQAAMALDPELYAGAIDDLQRWADEAEQTARDAADRELAEEYAARIVCWKGTALGTKASVIDQMVAFARARAEASRRPRLNKPRPPTW